MTTNTPVAKPQGLDPARVRVALRRLPREALLHVLDRAIGFVPPARLADIVVGHVQPEGPRHQEKAAGALLRAVRRFHAASLRGEYYESFRVDSKNFMQRSESTDRWLAECGRLVERCAAHAEAGQVDEARKGFELLFDLLAKVDCGEEIVFFADEGGSYEACIEWRNILPSWFKCLAQTASPADYRAGVLKAIDEHSPHERGKLLKKARAIAKPEQRTALPKV